MKVTFDFICNIVNSLAWPIVSIIIAAVFRHPIQDLLKRIGRLKFKDIEADFSKEINDVKEEAKVANIVSIGNKVKPIKAAKSLSEEVEEIAHISPEAAIPFAWTKVESTIMDLVVRSSISPDYPFYNSVLKNINLIREQYNLDARTVNVMESLRRLRNEVLHAHPQKGIYVTYKDAIDYGRLAEGLIDKIESLQ